MKDNDIKEAFEESFPGIDFSIYGYKDGYYQSKRRKDNSTVISANLMIRSFRKAISIIQDENIIKNVTIDGVFYDKIHPPKTDQSVSILVNALEKIEERSRNGKKETCSNCHVYPAFITIEERAITALE
jgi:transcriptional antiterminator